MSRHKRIFCLPAAVLLLIVSATSCITVNETMGSVYVPRDRDLKVHTFSFDLPVGMKMADSLQSSTSYFVLGNINDADYGITTASFAATVNPPDTLPWGQNPRFVGAKLQFVKFSMQTFEDGQEEIPQNIHVYALTTPMDTTKIYCNSLGPEDHSLEEIMEGAVIYTGGDTLTIPLKDSFAREYMNATQEELDSTDLFIKRFYGIYVESDAPLGGSTGGRLVKFSAGAMSFKFNSVSDTGEQRDTTVMFPIGSSYATELYSHSTRSLEVGSDNNLKTLSYEGLAGIKPHIDAGAIRDSIAAWAQESGVNLLHPSGEQLALVVEVDALEVAGHLASDHADRVVRIREPSADFDLGRKPLLPLLPRADGGVLLRLGSGKAREACGEIRHSRRNGYCSHAASFLFVVDVRERGSPLATRRNKATTHVPTTPLCGYDTMGCRLGCHSITDSLDRFESCRSERSERCRHTESVEISCVWR